jgi:hypothetical protein
MTKYLIFGRIFRCPVSDGFRSILCVLAGRIFTIKLAFSPSPSAH